MDNNNLPELPIDRATQTTEELELQEKHPYHAPTLVCHGGLAELVQHRPGSGADGDIFSDCTRS